LISTPRAVSAVVEKPNKAICAIVGALRFGLFTEFIHQYLAAISYGRSRCWRHRDRQVASDAGKNLVQQRELPIGDVIQAAIDNGLQ